jgi:PAS domain S-box-containing protein
MRNIGLSLGNRAAPARAAATVAIMCGAASVTGWVLGIQPLTSIIPGSAEMKINTAVGMLLAGVSLLILADAASLRLERVARLFSVAVLLLGLATLAEYVSGRSFGIDEFLFRDHVGAYNVFRGRMSPITATAFITLALSLLAVPHRKLRRLAIIAAVLTMVIAGISLVGYLWNATEIITDHWIPPVALNTAACFFLLGAGVLLTPRQKNSDFDQQLASLAAVEIKILGGFISAMMLLLIGGSYTYRTSVQLAESVAWVAHTEQVRSTLQSIYGSLAGAEVALRDYLLTRDDDNDREYQKLRGDAASHLEQLRLLTVDNPVQRANIVELDTLVEGRLAAMASSKTAFADFGLPAARAIISTTRKIHATQEVRVQIGRMDAEEVRLLNQRNRTMSGVRATTLMSLVATLAVATVVFLTLFRAIHREMKARREAENQLRASDQYTRNILDSSPDCLGVLDLDGRLIQMTPNALRLMEIDDFATLQNVEWTKLWTGADRTAAAAALQNALDGHDGRFQGVCPTLKGTHKWWDVIVKPINGTNGRPERLLTASRDITEVKRAEQQLSETNNFLDSLFENLPLMVYVKDARTLRYVRINRECERLTGFTREAMIGRTAHDLLPPAQAEAIERMDLDVLTTGRLTDIAEEVVSTADRGPRSRHTVKVPIFDSTGAAQYLLGISEDVTDRKQAEKDIRDLNSALEAKAGQLEVTNKELESFSYSVSHDLRAPLRAIDGFAQMIEEDYSEVLDPEGRRYLTVIRDNSRRMGGLIDDLLEFSRLGRLPVVTHEVNVDMLVHEVIDEVLVGNGTAAPRIDIGALPSACGDRGLLRQVWINLLANAIKYSSKGPKPCITVRGDRTATENLYSVRDNGVGFNMAYADKLFGVFQRLHRADEFSGTGVGLAIVHRIVSRHGGRVWAEGKLNDGAVFSFALPREVADG